MGWSKSAIEKISDVMRFLAYACLAIDLIMFAGFSVWLIAKFLWYLAGWINHHIFPAPWN
jgi:hypothetical protein